MSAAAVDGVAIGGTLGRDKEEMRDVVGMTAARLPEEAPRHLLGIGEPDDLVEGIGLGIDLFDCAVPTRLARHGMALAPLPGDALPLRRPQAREFARGPSAAGRGLPLPDVRCAHARAYVHYLSRAEELTGRPAAGLHNLAYLERLVARRPRGDRRRPLGAYRDAILGGSPPWAAA